MHHVRRDYPSYVGCFSTSQPLSLQGYYEFQSSGYCGKYCKTQFQPPLPVLGLSNGTDCYCGSKLPPNDSKVSDSQCDTPCQGYDKEDCGGGTEYFSVWLTGSQDSVANANDAVTSRQTSITSMPTSTKTQNGSPASSMATSTSTSSPSSNESNQQSEPVASKSGGGSDNKLAIILGVVLGFVALAIMAVLFWFLWRRRRRTGKYQRERSPSPSPAEKVEDSPEPGERTRDISTAEPAVDRSSTLQPPPMVTHPSVSEYSRSTSFDQPFYTPAEQRSIRYPESMDQAEEQPEHARFSFEEPVLPQQDTTPTTQPSERRFSIPRKPVPVTSSSQPTHPITEPQNPFSSPSDRGMTTTTVTSPTTTTTTTVTTTSGNKTVMPSKSEVDEFDFTGDGQRPLSGWYASKERKEGRHELPGS